MPGMKHIKTEGIGKFVLRRNPYRLRC